jgi:RNA polymerase sigma-70 factor, ECF subfamily
LAASAVYGKESTRTAENRLTALKDEADERRLIAAAQKDSARFADLYELHFDRVYAFIASRVRNRDAAEDLTADVFHQALANIGQFEWRGVRFAAWLFRIAANSVSTWWKKSGRESGEAAPEESAPSKVDIETIERRAQLFTHVRRLPPEQRLVIQMRFAEEKPIAEIAEQLRKSEGAIKQLQFRALQTLREKMGSTSKAVKA